MKISVSTAAFVAVLLLAPAVWAQSATAQTQPATPQAQPAKPQPGTPQTPAQPAPKRVRPRTPAPTQIFVRSQSGRPLPDTRVLISGTETHELTTDAQGTVAIPLAPGSYRLRFEREDFITLERDETIKSGPPPEIDIALDAAPPPPLPPPPPPPTPTPTPTPPPVESGPPVNVSIPDYLEKNFIGRDPLKESILGCTVDATTRLLQLRDSLAVHAHADMDEVIYVVAGTGAIRTRDTTTNVAPGSLSVIPRGVSHSIERRGGNPLIVLSILAGAPCRAASDMK
jgi:mannose-6-phosphate isomerase-like protein (cupin superfamily)